MHCACADHEPMPAQTMALMLGSGAIKPMPQAEIAKAVQLKPLPAIDRQPLLVVVLRRGRQVPALIAAFEQARTAVSLQRDTEMVRPDRHPEFS